MEQYFDTIAILLIVCSFGLGLAAGVFYERHKDEINEL